MQIKVRNIQFLFLFVYLVAMNAFNLGTGFDAFFVRISFVLFVAVVMLPEMRVKMTPHLVWAISFWALYFLSVLWASNLDDTLYYFNSFAQILGLAVCMPLLVKNEDDLDLTLNFIVFSMLIAVARLYLVTPASAWGTERLGSSIGFHPNDLGLRLSIAAVVALYMAHKQLALPKSKRRTYIVAFYFVIAIVMAAVALFSGSRKAMFFSIAGIAAYEIFVSRGWKTLLKVVVVVAAVIVVWNLVMTNEGLYHVLGRRVDSMLKTFFEGSTTDYSISERNFYIQKALQLFSDNPILGYGGNNFATYMREIGYRHIAYSHNNFTELLSTLGIVGFVIYYSFWLYVILRAIKNYMRSRNPKMLMICLILGFIILTDYWRVSYISDYNQLVFFLAYMAVQFEGSGARAYQSLSESTTFNSTRARGRLHPEKYL